MWRQIYISGGYVCEKCGNETFDDFGKIKAYIDEHGPSPGIVISEATGVPIAKINRYLRQGRIEIPDGSGEYIPCEKCGQPIRYGRFCPACAAQLAKSISVVLTIKNGDKFLILQKWYDDRITEPYQWEFVDGDLEYGISPDAYVRQMVNDATGLDAVIDSIPYTWSYELGDMQIIGIAYLCHVDSDMVILSEAVSDFKWVKAEELPEYIENRGVLADLAKTGII